jgi:alginate O-acetyltransferase complex protein AlgI
MLFNSYVFIFVFAPVVFSGFFLTSRLSREYAVRWVAFASLVFYAWWDVRFLLLLMPSIVINYWAGILLVRDQRKWILWLAIALNLLALFYFKYWTFALTSIRAISGLQFAATEVVLPIGISFFTFTQIAFLVDAYQGKAKEYNFWHYLFFVSYFPHLVAGPIIHHGEIMPQLREERIYRFNPLDVLLGVTIFTIGLSKKMLLADALSPHANALFDAARDGASLTFLEAWAAALLYSFQIYFDFSGYTDMAIGLSLIIGIRLPINFASPYKATSIIEFWRRWHMTLSRFLRDYLYIPLGGNRRGPVRRYTNLILTMALGGLWHGAAWTFLVWGLLHGFYLLINHWWRSLENRPVIPPFISGGITFVAVAFAWVFFRAADLHSALSISIAMVTPDTILHPSNQLLGRHLLALLGLSGGLVWLFPNTQQITEQWHPVLQHRLQSNPAIVRVQWVPSIRASLVIAILLAVCIMSLSNVSDFIYFKF